MKLIVIDNDNNEYNYNFDSKLFTFFVVPVKNNQYSFTITNLNELDIELKVELVNLFETIKTIDIKNIYIKKDDIIIFDSLAYGFAHDTFDYNSSYEYNDSILIDKVKFTFLFVKNNIKEV